MSSKPTTSIHNVNINGKQSSVTATTSVPIYQNPRKQTTVEVSTTYTASKNGIQHHQSTLGYTKKF